MDKHEPRRGEMRSEVLFMVVTLHCGGAPRAPSEPHFGWLWPVSGSISCVPLACLHPSVSVIG